MKIATWGEELGMWHSMGSCFFCGIVLFFQDNTGHFIGAAGVQCGYFNCPLNHVSAGRRGGREGHLSLCRTVYNEWGIALIPSCTYKFTSMHAHSQILKPSLTLTDIHTFMVTHSPLLPFLLLLALSNTHTHTHAVSVSQSLCLLWAERAKKMKNEPNNVRPKAAPIKRINGPRCARTGWRFYDCCWT